MIKSKDKTKFCIEQFILNNVNNFQEWTNERLSNILVDNVIIGYIFSVREGSVLCTDTQVLNLYLIKRKYYNGAEVTIDALVNAWELFLFRCDTEQVKSKKLVFLNPPIKEFIDTKENWCKKLATKLSTKYNKTFDEALSDVYLTIMNCYTRGTVYIGSLSYIERAAHNLILMEIRNNKIRVNQDSGLAVSLDQVVTESANGEELTLLDMIANDENIGSDLEFEQLKTKAISILSKTFSSREIDQILNTKQSLLPRPLYKRLWKWRQTNTMEDLYDEKNC